MKFIIKNAKNKSFFPKKDYGDISIYKKISELSNEKDHNFKVNDSYFAKEEHYFENNLNNYSTFKPGYNLMKINHF